MSDVAIVGDDEFGVGRLAEPRPAWMDDARCRTERIPTDVFYPPVSPRVSAARLRVLRDPAGTAVAVAVCEHCPVIGECREYAHRWLEQDGVWGGEGPLARQRILRGIDR